MTCEFCGAELPDNARFCGKCGKTPSVAQSLQASKEAQEPQIAQPAANIANTQHREPMDKKSKWLAGTSPQRLIIGLIIIIIVASGLGIAAAVIHTHLTGTANSATPPTCINQSNGTTCTQQTAIARHGRSVSLRLSGAVNGRLTSVKITRCGVAGLPYDVLVQGKVGGTSYSLVFRITAYHGAGIYSVGQIFANFTQQPVSPTTAWATTGTQPSTATVGSTTKTGTMNITLTGANSTIHITGSWVCG